MGCGAGKHANEAKRKTIVVFDATGRQGQSVLKALMLDPQLKPVGVYSSTQVSNGKELTEMGFTMIEASLDEPDTLKDKLPAAYGCFISTNYWEHYDITKDSLQGKSAVDWAVKTGVHHAIYSGQESPKAAINKCCDPFDSKKRVEDYLKKQKTDLNFTVIRLAFLYDNLLSLVKPQKLKDGQFAIPLPMGDVTLHGIAADDVGRCVCKLFRNPEKYRRKVVPLSGDQLTVQEYVDVLNRRLTPKVFVNPQITLEDYSQFNFKGSKEILSMFAYYKLGQPFRAKDVKSSKKLYKNLKSFDEWVNRYKHQLHNVTIVENPMDTSISEIACDSLEEKDMIKSGS